METPFQRTRRSLGAVLFPRRYTPFGRITSADAIARLRTSHPTALLAHLAHAAYHDTDAVGALLDPLGATTVAGFDRRATQGFLAEWPTHATLVFRGTEPDKLRDLVADSKFLRVPCGEARVHRGFLEKLDILWPDIAPRLASIETPVWVTGHSLGGAMATLAGLRHPFEGVVTFGEPRVGTGVAAGFTARRHLRVVNGRDPIVTLPPAALGFEHHGETLDLADPDGPSARYDHAIVAYAELLEMLRDDPLRGLA